MAGVKGKFVFVAESSKCHQREQGGASDLISANFDVYQIFFSSGLSLSVWIGCYTQLLDGCL